MSPNSSRLRFKSLRRIHLPLSLLLSRDRFYRLKNGFSRDDVVVVCAHHYRNTHLERETGRPPVSSLDLRRCRGIFRSAMSRGISGLSKNSSRLGSIDFLRCDARLRFSAYKREKEHFLGIVFSRRGSFESKRSQSKFFIGRRRLRCLRRIGKWIPFPGLVVHYSCGR